MVKNLPANARRLRFDPSVRKIPWRRKWQPTRVLAWRIPWTEEPGGYCSWGCRELDKTEHACMHTTLSPRIRALGSPSSAVILFYTVTNFGLWVSLLEFFSC